MNGFIAFFKKEWLEAIRTKRLVILLTAFAILGIISPLTALLTPFILESSLPEGFVIDIPEPTALDAWASFYNSIAQMGSIVILLLFAGLLVNDVQKQALIPLLTKGLSRPAVIVAKLANTYLLWTLAYLLCFIVSYGYTYYYWDMSAISNLALSMLSVWIAGLFLLTLLIFSASIFLSFSGALLGAAGIIGALLVLPIFEETNRFNPLRLYSEAPLLLSSSSISQTLWQMASTLIYIVLLIFASIYIFNRKKL